ncbi:Gfo/Idh/MocA family protein [Bacteroidota bacterium]
MSDNHSIRWGIIGCGNVTEVKSGPAFQKASYSELVAVMRRDASKAQDYARRHGVRRAYSNADDLINDPEIDAIYVATPPDKHAFYAIKAMTAAKAVYVEKPMARTYEECLMMIKVSIETKTPLFTAYYRRSLPYYLNIKGMIDDKIIGDVRRVDLKLMHPPKQQDYSKDNLPWRVKPEISGGGYFYDLASHQLDVLDFYFGSVKKQMSYAENRLGLYPAEDFVRTELQYESGLEVTGEWNFGAHEDEFTDKTIIHGTKGRIVFSFFNGAPITLRKGIWRKRYHIRNPENIQLPHIQNIVDELRGKGKCPADNTSSARTNQLMEEIVKDYYTRFNT